MINYTLLESQEYGCTLITAEACGGSSYGLNCQNGGFPTLQHFYKCNFNIDIQNETSYTCNRYFNDTFGIYRNDSVCDVDFKLKMASVVYESAIKDMWLSLPMPQICEWDQLSCSHNQSNRSYQRNVRHHRTFVNAIPEYFECMWSFQNDFKQYLPNQTEYDWNFLFVIFFIISGGVGNILVCLAICLDKRLQNVTNYFLLSLAIADLLVSLFVMPMGAIPGFIVRVGTTGRWPLGAVWCNVYVTCDVLACSASILHMCFISVSRYMGIRNPLRSRHRSTKRVVIIKIALVWFLSMIVSSFITVLGIISEKNIMPNQGVCVINNRVFWIFGSLVAFYIPMMTMVVSFALTVYLLKKQAKLAVMPVFGGTRRRLCGFDTGLYGIRRMGARSSPNLSSSGSLSKQKAWRVTAATISNHERNKIGMSVSNPQLCYINGSEASRSVKARNVSTQTSPNVAVETRRAVPGLLKLNTNTPNPLTLRFLPNRKKDRTMTANAVANEQKATKVLGLVFFTFVLCWAPFFLLNIIFASCPTCSVPDNVVDVCLWLGYVSSTINPIIYTIFNRTFRNAFLRLLCCQCSRRGRCTLYRCTAGSTRGASQLCAQSSLPLAASLRPYYKTEAPVAASTDTIMIEPPLPSGLQLLQISRR